MWRESVSSWVQDSFHLHFPSVFFILDSFLCLQYLSPTTYIYTAILYSLWTVTSNYTHICQFENTCSSVHGVSCGFWIHHGHFGLYWGVRLWLAKISTKETLCCVFPVVFIKTHKCFFFLQKSLTDMDVDKFLSVLHAKWTLYATNTWLTPVNHPVNLLLHVMSSIKMEYKLDTLWTLQCHASYITVCEWLVIVLHLYISFYIMLPLNNLQIVVKDKPVANFKDRNSDWLLIWK